MAKPSIATMRVEAAVQLLQDVQEAHRQLPVEARKQCLGVAIRIQAFLDDYDAYKNPKCKYCGVVAGRERGRARGTCGKPDCRTAAAQHAARSWQVSNSTIIPKR